MFIISSSSPGQNATGVDPDAALTVTFSAAVEPESVSAGSATLYDADGDVPLSVSVAGDTLIIQPLRRLAPDRPHTLKISTSVSSTAGEELSGIRTIIFFTAGPSWHAPSFVKPISTSAWGEKTFVGLVMHDDNSATLVWVERDDVASDIRIVAAHRNSAGTFGPREVLATMPVTPSPLFRPYVKAWRTVDNGAAVFWTPVSAGTASLRLYRPGVGWSTAAQIPVPPSAGMRISSIWPMDPAVAAPDGIDAVILVSRSTGPASTPVFSEEIGRVLWPSTAPQPTYQPTLKVLPEGSPSLGSDPHATAGQPIPQSSRVNAVSAWRNASATDAGVVFAFREADPSPFPKDSRCVAVTYSFKTGVLARAIIATKLPLDINTEAVLVHSRADGSATVFIAATSDGNSPAPICVSEYSSESGVWAAYRIFIKSPVPFGLSSISFDGHDGAHLPSDEAGFQLLLASLSRTSTPVEDVKLAPMRSLLYDPVQTSWNVTNPPDPHFDLGTAKRLGEGLGNNTREAFFPSTGRFEGIFYGGWAVSFDIGRGWAMPYRVLTPTYYGHQWMPQAIAQNASGRGLALWVRKHDDFPSTNVWFISEFS